MHMVLAFDIGNSDITIGLYNGTGWQHIWRVPSQADLPEMFYAMKLREYFLENRVGMDEVSHVAVSSVVPDLTARIAQTARALFGKEPVVLGPAVFERLPIKVLRPYEIGSDLVCNAFAAYSFFKRSCVVVDFGTALTFTTLSPDGEIMGVSIAPGLKTAIKSLSQNTARLFDVPLIMPESVLGRGTVHAIQAGVLVGYEGMVKHMLQRIRTELKDETVPSVATGGLSSIITSLQETFSLIDPNLTLNGLRLIAALG